MWSKSIEILNPSEAIRESLEKNQEANSKRMNRIAAAANLLTVLAAAWFAIGLLSIALLLA